MIAGLDLLGPARPTDARLGALVEAQVGLPVHDLDGNVEEVAYDVPALTTAGRWWVRGEARTAQGSRPFGFFVKTVRPWHLSPLFAHVPEELHEIAARSFPWATEPAVYRSDLAEVLPAGLRMPRAYDVVDLDGPMTALWLEAVDDVDRPWDRARHVRAAHLLGRLAASPATRTRATLGGFPLDARLYLDGRVTAQVVPALRSDLWEHPSLTSFAELREPMLASLERLPLLVEEIDALPRLAGHGDAAPGNLLADPVDPDGFVVIDFGLWNLMPLAHDLTQLLVGDVQIGRRPAGDLAALDDALLEAYGEGLSAEGLDVDPDTLRRAHALQLHLFAGITALPVDMLDLPDQALAAVAPERAVVARLSLDLLAATDP